MIRSFLKAGVGHERKVAASRRSGLVHRPRVEGLESRVVLSSTDILPTAAAQGQWSSIRTGHQLITMTDSNVLDFQASTGDWKLYKYDPTALSDVLPTRIASGNWSSIRSGHTLLAMPDGKVLDWVASTGDWRLWNYNPTSTSDILPGSAVAFGNWSSIRTGHSLIPMSDGKVLDFQASTGNWHLWKYDARNTSDILPTAAGHGTWSSIGNGHTLIPMNDGKMIDWVASSGDWRLWKYDATTASDVLPTLATSGHWNTINAKAGDQLVPMLDGKVLDWIPSTGSWHLWNYVPPGANDATNLYVDFGDSLTGTRGMTRDGTTAATVADLLDSYNGPNLNGDTSSTGGTFTSSSALSFRPFNTIATSKGFSSSEITAIRNNILATIRRYYQPFNVNVVVASNNRFDAIHTLLGQGNRNGVYVQVEEVDGAGGSLTGWNGYSHGTDLSGPGQPNASGDIAIVFADTRFNGYTHADADKVALAFASTVSHEAGHTFGLRHTDNKSTNDNIAIANDDVMSVAGNSANALNYNTFLRFPLGTLPGESYGDRVTKENPFDVLARNLGLNPLGPVFITGTSAYDHITITRAGSGTASVRVAAYRDPAMTSLIQTYQYSVPTALGLFVDTNLGADVTEVDATLGCTVSVRAVEGADSVIVDGNTGLSAIYSPSPSAGSSLSHLPALGGTVSIGATTVRFQDFSSSGTLTLDNFARVTFQGTAGADRVTLAPDKTIGHSSLSGTVNGGYAFLPLILSNSIPMTLIGGDGANVLVVPGAPTWKLTGPNQGTVNGIISFTAFAATPLAPTSVALTLSSPGGVVYGQTSSVTAKVTSLSGIGTPSGSARLRIDGVFVGSSVVLIGGVIKITIPSLARGNHKIDVFYTSDSTNFDNSSATVTLLVK